MGVGRIDSSPWSEFRRRLDCGRNGRPHHLPAHDRAHRRRRPHPRRVVRPRTSACNARGGGRGTGGRTGRGALNRCHPSRPGVPRSAGSARSSCGVLLDVEDGRITRGPRRRTAPDLRWIHLPQGTPRRRSGSRPGPVIIPDVTLHPHRTHEPCRPRGLPPTSRAPVAHHRGPP